MSEDIKTRVFISYKTENREFAKEVRARILNWGLLPWIDFEDIPVGVPWPDAIDEALHECDIVIGIVSPVALESRNVKNEWDWAIAKNKRLILLLYERVDFPVNYISINFIDFTKDHLAGFAKLYETLISQPIRNTSDEYLQSAEPLGSLHNLIGNWSWTDYRHTGWFAITNQRTDGTFEGHYLKSNAHDIGTISGKVVGDQITFVRRWMTESQEFHQYYSASLKVERGILKMEDGKWHGDFDNFSNGNPRFAAHRG